MVVNLRFMLCLQLGYKPNLQLSGEGFSVEREGGVGWILFALFFFIFCLVLLEKDILPVEQFEDRILHR